MVEMKAFAPGKANYGLEFICQYFKSAEMNAASAHSPLTGLHLGNLKSGGGEKKKLYSVEIKTDEFTWFIGFIKLLFLRCFYSHSLICLGELI